ncbi:MAG: hypothetical protein KJ052_06225 [Candidatus Hydrogenedentes bacterium]|nr:hypothetical protein [Candidatus Hydrogenedentota bacterium]
MALFPRTEPQTVILAQNITAGLAANAAIYPSLPVAAADLQTGIEAYITARDATEEATAAKNESLQALTDDMKAELRYPENSVDYDNDELMHLNWGGLKTKTSLEAPGPRLTLEVPREGWVLLDWKEFVVLAINTVGENQPRNTVMAVL